VFLSMKPFSFLPRYSWSTWFSICVKNVSTSMSFSSYSFLLISSRNLFFSVASIPMSFIYSSSLFLKLSSLSLILSSFSLSLYSNPFILSSFSSLSSILAFFSLNLSSSFSPNYLLKVIFSSSKLSFISLRLYSISECSIFNC